MHGALPLSSDNVHEHDHNQRQHQHHGGEDGTGEVLFGSISGVHGLRGIGMSLLV